MEKNLAYSAQYKNALPGIDTLNQLYGLDINTKSAKQNNDDGMEMRGKAVDKARGTGLDTDAFIEAMGRTASYGKMSFDGAADFTRTQALWSRFTGADLGALQKFAGQAFRYGGENNATSTAYAGLMAQGMGKGQFTEFLNSLEKVMADGISKGYVKSTAEIAGNMALMYKLSGGSALWQEEQGAQRISQMNNALANATNLQSVGDVINYSVVRDILGDGDNREANFYKAMNIETDKNGKPINKYDDLYTGTYLDEMMVMGRGVSGDILQGQYKYLKGKEGNNEAAIVEHLKNMNGLNDIGGVQLLRMMQRGERDNSWNSKEFEEQMKQILENPEYKSDSAILADNTNALKQLTVQIGQLKFPIELEALDKVIKIIQKDYKKTAEEIYKAEMTARHEDVLIPETGPGGIPTTNTVSTVISDYYGISDRAINANLMQLSQYEGANANSQTLKRKFNSEVLPRLVSLNGDDISDEIRDFVYNLQRSHSNAVTDRTSEAGTEVGVVERDNMMNIMRQLIIALDRNTLSTDENTNSEFTVEAEITE